MIGAHNEVTYKGIKCIERRESALKKTKIVPSANKFIVSDFWAE